MEADGSVCRVATSPSPLMSDIMLKPNILRLQRSTLVLIAMPLSEIEVLITIIWVESIELINKDVLNVSDKFSSLMSNLGGGRWQCLTCGYQSLSTIVRNHIEAKHLSPSEGYNCPHCNIVLRNRVALNNHLSKKHRDVHY